MLGKSLSETVACDQPERVIKRRRKIARDEPKTRVQPERKCNVPKSYVGDAVQRGTDGGYKKSLRSVRGIVSSRAQWRHYNEEKKRTSHKKTLERQSDRLEIAKLAYTKLSEVSLLIVSSVISFYDILIVLFCFVLQAMTTQSVKHRIQAVYTLEPNEKMSEAKAMRILDRIPPLVQYFKAICEGKSKADASTIASEVSMYSAHWIGMLAKEFISEVQIRRVTVWTEQDCQKGPVPSQVRKSFKKKRYRFGKFSMGTNRRVQSVMYDQEVRARATVWLRLNCKRKTGKPSMNARTFLRYLQTDLLKGVCIYNLRSYHLTFVFECDRSPRSKTLVCLCLFEITRMAVQKTCAHHVLRWS